MAAEKARKQQDAGCQVHVVMQMLEVYNEKLNDLLAEAEPNSPNALKKPIKIHVHPELGVYLTGATEAPVKTAEECIKTIQYGNTMKVVHATAMNAQSSRGHTICKLNVVKEGGKDNVTSNSEVYFADLAGRENERSTQVTGERFVELGFINKSLHHLSNCIRDLGQTEKRRKTICAEAVRAKAAPIGPSDMSKFRNSKLTLLLSNALSGNSRTSMIGTLSPASSNFEESHNTLKFASTVKTIKVQAKAAKALDKFCCTTPWCGSNLAMARPKIFPPLSLLDGRSMPSFGLGVYRSPPGTETYNAVRWALDLGYRLVDTAALYRNEESVGEAIRDSGLPREEVWVTTKLWDSDHGYEAAKSACQQSLKKLGLGYIDLYLIHSPNTGKLVETWDAFVELQREGLVKSIGVSNFGVQHLEALKASGRPLPVVNQIDMHPLIYQERRSVIEYCKANGICITAYGSMFSGDTKQLQRRVQHLKPNLLFWRELLQVQEAHPGQSAAQILLRWALQKGFQIIPKSVHQERLQENMNLLDFELSPAEMESLSKMKGALGQYWNPLKSKVDLGRTDLGRKAAPDALVRDLKNEILELRKQLEQAKEKHDDEALKEIADHLEASHAIVAAQTRDWVDFEEENAELSKKRARSFIRSSSHEMFPYLANHSEDPHLCFKLVMHVPEGKEQSLGSDISSDFRLPPALGVCETTGFIRNQGGCLTLRPAAASSGRFASIEVNGNKLSREQELQHLDCVLFGRSTTFYVFLQHASAEEVDQRLRASRADMEDWDGRITQPLVDKILGEVLSVRPFNALHPEGKLAEDAAVTDTESTAAPDQAQSKNTVKQRFQASDRPGVKLRYHQSFGSKINVSECDRRGAWRQTHSPIDERGWVYVKEIDGVNVIGADPQVVAELWATHMNGTDSYTVTFTTEPAYVTLCCYAALCVLPWSLATFMACCALPCMICRIYTGTAFQEAGSEELEGSDKEPVPRLKDSFMSFVVEHPVTRLSLVGYGVGQVILALKTYAFLVPMAPSTCAIVLSPHMLLSGLVIFVAIGVKATQGNALLKGEAMCPQGLTKVLSTEIRFLLALLAPSLLIVYPMVSMQLFALPMFVHEALTDPDPHPEGLFLSLQLLSSGPLMLVFVSLPHFLINSHVLARIVERHVRTVTTKVEDIHCFEKQKEGEGIKQLQLKFKEVHKACIRLPVDVLPSLECIALPTFGFAACSWGWAFMTMVALVSGHVEDISEMKQWLRLVCLLLRLLVLLPFGVICLLPPASVSDAFDQLLDSLNRLRALEGMDDDPQIRLTESFIIQSNRGQGLGFVYFGTVINTRFIKALFLKVATYASLLFSFYYKARSKDPAEVKLAREYCDLLRGQNRDSEGELMLRAFMCQARRARVKVDEANELTRCVRPSSGLHFELAAQAPVLSYGFYRCANLPELCVRLVRRTRFRAAVRKVMAQLKKQNLIQAAVRSFLPAKSESISSDYQLLSTWTLPKFYARLEMMYEAPKALAPAAPAAPAMAFEDALQKQLELLKVELLQAHWASHSASHSASHLASSGNKGSRRSSTLSVAVDEVPGQEVIPNEHDEEVAVTFRVSDQFANGIANRWARLSRALLAPPPSEALALHADWVAAMPDGQGRRPALQCQEPQEGRRVRKHGEQGPIQSLAAIQNSEKWCMVLQPQSKIRLVMSILGLICITWDVVFIPVQAFENLSEIFEEVLQVATVLVFLYWVLDFLLQFISAPDNTSNSVDLKPSNVALRYVKGWMFMDLLLLGLDIGLFSAEAAIEARSATTGLNSVRLIRVLRLLRFFRLLRLRRVQKTLVSILTRFISVYFWMAMQMMKGIMIILVINHYVSIGWLVLGVYYPGRTWLSDFQLQDVAFSEQYVYAFHWAIAQFLPSTTNISPVHGLERLYAVLAVLLSFGVLSSFITGVTNTVNALRAVRVSSLTQEAKLRQFFVERKLPARLLKLCLNAYHEKADSASIFEQDVAILQTSPERLRAKVHEEMFKPVFMRQCWTSSAMKENSWLLINLCHLAITEQATEKSQDVFLTGTDCHGAVILTHGLMFYSDDYQMSSLSTGGPGRRRLNRSTDLGHQIQEGQWLCEISLFSQWWHRGQLSAQGAALYAYLDATKFVHLVAENGGFAYMFLRTFGILLTAYVEDLMSTEMESDIVEEESLRQLRDRATHFMQISKVVTGELNRSGSL
eukprot:s628_g17.t1